MTIMRGDHHGGEASLTWSLDPVLDPVDLELAAGIFQSLAEEMGVSLVRSARSANIKERRDSSTAIFDHRGRQGAQVYWDVFSLSHKPASVVKNGGGRVSPFLDVRRAGGANQRHPHLFSQRLKNPGRKFKIHRVKHRVKTPG